jgi:hypothetical protein
MKRIVLKSRVDADGTLHLSLPLGQGEAHKEVQVTVEPAPPVPLLPEEWRRTVLSTAGKWQGEFQRPVQGTPEEREPLS